MLALKLDLEQELIDSCREYTSEIADEIGKKISNNTTTSVERTVLRLLGVDGVDQHGIPLPNVIVEKVKEAGELDKGISYWFGNALLETDLNVQSLAEEISKGDVDLFNIHKRDKKEVYDYIYNLAKEKAARIKENVKKRNELMEKYPPGPQPWLYVIVATGNIYEDVKQAKSAARQGADIVAVIRSTAQSLLDYVPYGPTTEGFGGTYATQANFKIMREALDEVSKEEGHYVQLVNYCSGLAMPEIAAMGAIERLDMMLNDAMYGILFRDINMKRTFVDQYFSRMINAYAGVIINTGEDNYLTTADAVEEAHTVLASQFINEELGLRTGLKKEQLGLGHAFEIDPEIEDSFLMEIAQAQLVRQVFPDSPLKYMPPTKYMDGDIFKGHLMDGMFNVASIITDQSIQLLGMLTEAIHTPFLQDRALSIENAKHVFNSARTLSDEITFKSDGKIQKRADQVLEETAEILEEISNKGLMKALSEGIFGDIKRPMSGGKGSDGVVTKSSEYFNPFIDVFKEELKIDAER
ncbi:MAG: lysine 5,6-aminomutase subunit alpha [Halanaerobiales bacterium]|nr:lysine 5,6-aminomutase subunit alpha [Halanaerobiales bacterium]